MRNLLLLLVSFGSIIASAQQKKISIEDIYQGAFRMNYFGGFYASGTANQYTILEKGTEINLYDFASQTKIKTLFDASTTNINEIKSYSFDNQEQKILIATNYQPIYRHSFKGLFHIYDIENKKLISVTDKYIQEPTFSPDGQKIVYMFENNLYWFDIPTQKEIQITFDGIKNQIINGISDWVYEEEFGFVRMFDWNKDSQKIAFVRFDESKVSEFSMDIYGKELYPSQQVFKYPKAGENNSVVSVYLYDILTGKLEKLEINNPYYIPKIQWTNNANVLCIHTLNRHQNEFNLLYYNVLNNENKIVYTEKDNAYVDVNQQKLHILEDNSFFITSEKDGFNHLYRYNQNGKLIKKITDGNWEVTDFYGYDIRNQKIYYQSTERGSINRDVYSISIKGTQKKLLSEKIGINKALFSADFSLFINQHQSATEPLSSVLYQTKNLNQIKKIIDNEYLKEKVDTYSKSRKEFLTIRINGNELNMWMLKPQNFDPTQKYPVLMYQYSGPGSQSVQNKWLSNDDYWYLSLTQKGYIVVCVDGRGTGFKGADFKKITQLQLGKYETEDQIKTAEYLASLDFVDASRIGIWGWSFGGFISSNCILKGNHIFKTAIAVAPVTSWRFYDTIYTERFMKTPEENSKGYDENSPLNYANLLKGNYLLVHGTADDNVHVQNAMRLIEALVQHRKTFDWAIYPDKNHSIYGGQTRIHLFEKLTHFITNNL